MKRIRQLFVARGLLRAGIIGLVCLSISLGPVAAGTPRVTQPERVEAQANCENDPADIAAITQAVEAELPSRRPADEHRVWQLVGLCQQGDRAYGYVKSVDPVTGQALPLTSDLIWITRKAGAWKVEWPEDGPAAALQLAPNYVRPSGYRLPYPAGSSVYVTRHWYWALDLQSADLSPADRTIRNAKAGTALFVKGNSTRMCGDPPPDWECWKTANTVVIQSGPSEYVWYMHFAPNTIPPEIQEGAYIPAGATLGLEGATGWAGPSHVHFMVASTYSCCEGDGVSRMPTWPDSMEPVDFDEDPWEYLPWRIVSQNGTPLATPPAPTPTTVAPTSTPEPPQETPAAPALVSVAETPAAGCANPYTVLQGEWLYRIAAKCNVRVTALLQANPQIQPDRLTPGQQLNMPGGSAAPAPIATEAPTAAPVAEVPVAAPVAAEARTTANAACGAPQHVVVKGENLFRLAYNCGLTTAQLAARNGLAAPYIIYPGQVLDYP